MPHSYTKIWIHAVFGTKNREPLIVASVKAEIHALLRQQVEEMDCKLLAINGMPDHVHLLFLLNPQKSIADIIKQIKGASSHQINQTGLVDGRFAWQTGYGAFSVSESGVEQVQQYIKNQEQHHAKMTFEQEYQRFLKLHALSP